MLQHFGLTRYPLGKAITELWDDGPHARLAERLAGCWSAPAWDC